jgi:hypothetical protein
MRQAPMFGITALRAVAAAIALFVLPAGLSALEAKEGLVKIVVSEATGRLSLYKLVDIARGRYEALIFDQDPRTSFASLSMDGRMAKLGDASDYRFTVVRTDTGVRIDFRSSFCVVRQLIDFAKSDGSALADGVKVTFELENVSERDAQIGLRYLIDTWLAEKSGVHFTTDTRARVSEESALMPSGPDTWVATPGDRASFMIMLSGSGVDRPDKAVLANWKRLSDAPWTYDVNSQRNFTLVPYSINDSAVALYWDPQITPRGGIRRISFYMGSFNERGFKTSEAKTQTEEIFAQTVLSGQTPDAATSMAAELIAIRDLIARIDRALAAGGTIAPDEIAAWRKILEILEERKKGY